jgi:hypothetical protein
MSEKHDSVTPQRAHRRSGQKLTKEERRVAQEKFLKSFSMTANVRAACMAAGISRNTVYAWQEQDEQFSFKFKQASEDANDMIRAELFRRSVQGYEKPVVSMGKVVHDKDGKPLMERVYSDSLLALLAKARMPEFRDKPQINVHAQLNDLAEQRKQKIIAELEAAIAKDEAIANEDEKSPHKEEGLQS